MAISSALFGQGSGPIHLDDVACSGSERRLIDCLYTHIDNCVHSKDAGVRCQGLHVCVYGCSTHSNYIITHNLVGETNFDHTSVA